MQLQYVSRTDYRRKDHPEFIAQLTQTYGDFYLLPEGGTNVLAIKGCAEIVEGLPDFDYVCCSCGTGGTLAGIVAGLQGKSQVLGFSALKGGDFLKPAVDQLTKAYEGHLYSNYEIITGFHGGGYAKANAELVDFINNFKRQSGIQLDPVYTGKMMYGIFSLAKEGFFRKDSAILSIHTGGLQGIAGFNRQHKSENLHIFID
jgi:1-aminocyclopropane-1-carboxylate deaminase/D-cysteine desulfhydrase-like pyridoxal-dependent ACC family enzyme